MCLPSLATCKVTKKNKNFLINQTNFTWQIHSRQSAGTIGLKFNGITFVYVVEDADTGGTGWLIGITGNGTFAGCGPDDTDNTGLVLERGLKFGVGKGLATKCGIV